MDLKWLEDFVRLARARNFSHAAAEANVTQSAFSRRIRGLEAWLGASLIDRSTYPVQLTWAGRQFLEEAEDILYRLNAVRNVIGSHGQTSEQPVRFSVQHSLARDFYPKWLQWIETLMGPVHSRLRADNLPNCIQDLRQGQIDFVICFDTPGIASFVDTGAFRHQIIGHDRLVPISAPGHEGPLHQLPGRKEGRIPHLSFGPDAPIGWHVEALLRRLGKECFLQRCYENSMGESLRLMAREGHGIAWLPETLIRDDMRAGLLVRGGDASWDIEMDIRIYRNKHPSHPHVEEIWAFLQSGERATALAARHGQ